MEVISFIKVINTESILDPGTPEMSSGTTIIYGEKDVTLKCTESTTYENQTDVTKYYLFGYSTDENATIDNMTWLDAQESDKDADGRSIITQATLKINKNEYIGTRYYRCGVFGRKKVDEDTNIDSNRVFSEGSAAVSINNAAITFNIAKEGGTLTGNSILYTRYGQSDLYTSITGTEESDKGNYPTAKKAGYSFEGWYSGSEGGTKIVNSNGSFANTNIAGYVENGKWIITKNITLYGHYTKNGSESDELGYYGVLTSLRAYLKTYKDVTLVFPKVEDATGYRICYKVSTSKNYNCNDRSSIGGIKLAAGKKYNFKVSPYKIINNKKFVSPNGKETSIYTLKKMSKPKVKKASSKKVKVTIKKVSGATGYQISTSTNKKKGYKVVKTVGAKTTKVKIKAKKGKKVYYKVRAYKSENGKKIYAPYSKVKKCTLR